MTGALVLLAVVYSAVMAGFCSWLAEQKGRERSDWLMLGLLFGVVALIALAGAPDRPREMRDDD